MLVDSISGAPSQASSGRSEAIRRPRHPFSPSGRSVGEAPRFAASIEQVTKKLQDVEEAEQGRNRAKTRPFGRKVC